MFCIITSGYMFRLYLFEPSEDGIPERTIYMLKRLGLVQK